VSARERHDQPPHVAWLIGPWAHSRFWQSLQGGTLLSSALVAFRQMAWGRGCEQSVRCKRLGITPGRPIES
jgi:hypothetical protein